MTTKKAGGLEPPEAQKADPEGKKSAGTRKVKMLRTVCRPEGSFQAGRTYEVTEKLWETFMGSRFAEEAK